MNKNRINRVFLSFLPIFLYLLLALVFTYPLITKFFTHIPGVDGDAYVYLYNQWWFKHAFVNGLDFFHSPLLLYPYGADLSLSVTTISNNLIISFFDCFLPTIAAFNLVIIFSFVAAAWGMFCLLRYLFKNEMASFIGGLSFAFHPYILYELSMGHYNYSTVYFIPFFILFLLKATQEGTRKYINASLAAIFLLIGFYNDLYYTYGLIFVLVLYFFWLWWQKGKYIINEIKVFLLIIITFVLFAWPLGWRLMNSSFSGLYPFATLEQISIYSPDVRSFFIPSFENIFFGEGLRSYYQAIGTHGSIIYIGYILTILAIIGYYVNHKHGSGPVLGYWRVLSIFFLFVLLGPIFYVGGIKAISGGLVTIPLPYQLLYFFPFLKGILVPSRLVIFFIISLIIPAAYGFKILLDRANSRFSKMAITMGCVVLILLEYAPMSLSLLDTGVSEFYRKLAAEESTYAVIELPFALSTSFYTLGDIKSSSRLEYFQSIHQKPILGGYVSRVPNYVYNYYNRLPGLKYAISPIKLMDDETIILEKEQVLKTFSDLKIGYIIIHPEYYVNLEYNKHQELVNTLRYFDKIFGQHSTEENLLIYDIRSYIK